MKNHEEKTAILSLYTLLGGGILGLIATLLLGNSPTIENTTNWIEYTTSKTYTVSYYLLIYAYLIPIIGFWAIHRIFSKDRKTFFLSFWGMILSVLGSALPMAAMGISAFALPAFGRISLSGGLDIAALTTDIFTPSTIIFLLFSGLYYLVGIILFGIVLWQSQYPALKLASISLILHGSLIILPEQFTINLLSWLFFLLSSTLVIVHSQKHTKQALTV